MPARADQESFQYALLRVVPSVARGEAMNVGVVLFCRRAGFLAARTHVDPERLRALDADLDLEAVRAHLDGLERVAAGDPDAGRVAQLEPSERFHWLAAPSSTVVQPSAVHTGLCDDPQAVLDRLYAELVASPRG
jgi:hypothetical protein